MQSAESNSNNQRNFNQINQNLSNRFHLSTDNGSQFNSSLNSSQISNNNPSNYNFSCPTPDQLRHRSLDYNCMTTNFNNGPISSSYVNQANYNYNNSKQFNNTYSQSIANSMQTNVLKNTNINSLPQSPYFISSNNTNSSSTSQPTGTNNTLAKGPNNSASMANGPPTLLLTTKDGQQTTMLVQQQPNTVSVADCNVTSGVLNSSPQVITINKPLTQQSGVNSQPILVSNTPGVLPGNMVLNMNTSRPVTPYVNASPVNVNNQQPRGIGPRVVLNNQIRLTAPQTMHIQRPVTQNLIGNSFPRGAILLKTDNGYQFLNVSNLQPTSTAPNILPQTTYRLNTVPASANTVATFPQAQNNIRPITNQQIVTLPASIASNIQRAAVITQRPNQLTGQRLSTPVTTHQINQPLTIQTTQANNQSANAAPSQMSPNTAKKKCKNFLSTLIKLASEQPENVSTNVRNLIQGLIDGNIQPEEFTVQLQRELNSSPQPCLIPFLKKSLPYLRYSLMMKELTIDGVKAPPVGSCQLPPIPQLQFQQRGAVRIVSTANVNTTNQNITNQNSTVAISNKTPSSKQVQKIQKQSVTVTAASLTSTTTSKSTASSKKKENVNKSKPASASKERKEKKPKEDKESFLSSLRDDDDINDVAAMGGVNLMEEHQRILANEELVGTQIRSCGRDEPFFFVNSLQERLNKISLNYGLEEVPMDVVALVSHAAQERLKTLVEKLNIIAEHRIENLKMDHRYEITQDVRSQIKFLDELDKLEKKRHSEQEREMLMKAAKSRSKAEDPEQLKLKQKAKEMQRAEMEEARQREANETALLAIGPRKKLKTSNTPVNSISTFNNSSNSTSLSLLSFTNSNKQQKIRRVKRVNLRDLQFLMEQEKQHVRSPILYKIYAK